MELTILKKIEEALGDKVPIQAFFDLIVGTRWVFAFLQSLLLSLTKLVLVA